MIICVEQGKGGKDRNVTLSPVLLDLLRAWCAQISATRRSFVSPLRRRATRCIGSIGIRQLARGTSP